jgi:glycosyltransferase involved in cell wall biosynthesis
MLAEPGAWAGAERMEVLYSNIICRFPQTRLTIACPDAWVEHFLQEVLADVEVKSLGEYDASARISWTRLLRVASWINEIKPDIVQTNEAKMRISVQLVRRLRLVKHKFSHVHMQHIKEVWRKSHLPERLLTGRGPDRWIAVSESVRSFLIERMGAAPHRIFYLPNYLSIASSFEAAPNAGLRAELGISEDEIFILAAGRLHQQKGFDVLIRAVSLLASRCSNFRVIIAGDGPERGDLELLINESDLQGRVQFVGWRKDLGQMLATADIYVLSSRWEGMPLILAEAVMAGPVLVATRVDGVDDILGQTAPCGSVVPPEDPESLGRALIDLVTSPSKRVEMQHAANKRRCSLKVEATSLPLRLASVYSELGARLAGPL